MDSLTMANMVKLLPVSPMRGLVFKLRVDTLVAHDGRDRVADLVAALRSVNVQYMGEIDTNYLCISVSRRLNDMVGQQKHPATQFFCNWVEDALLNHRTTLTKYLVASVFGAAEDTPHELLEERAVMNDFLLNTKRARALRSIWARKLATAIEKTNEELDNQP